MAEGEKAGAADDKKIVHTYPLVRVSPNTSWNNLIIWDLISRIKLNINGIIWIKLNINGIVWVDMFYEMDMLSNS